MDVDQVNKGYGKWQKAFSCWGGEKKTPRRSDGGLPGGGLFNLQACRLPLTLAPRNMHMFCFLAGGSIANIRLWRCVGVPTRCPTGKQTSQAPGGPESSEAKSKKGTAKKKRNCGNSPWFGINPIEGLGNKDTSKTHRPTLELEHESNRPRLSGSRPAGNPQLTACKPWLGLQASQ